MIKQRMLQKTKILKTWRFVKMYVVKYLGNNIHLQHTSLFYICLGTTLFW